MSVPPASLNLTFNGDSITTGNNTPDGDGFRRPVIEGLEAIGQLFTIQGRVQAVGTLPFPLNRCEAYPSHTIGELIPFVAIAPPCNMVTVHAGTVDVALGNPLNTMLTNLETLLDTWFAKGIYGLNLCQIIPQYPPSGGSPVLLQAYNAAMPALVAKKRREGRRIGLADCFTGFNPAWLVPDGVHVTTLAGSNWMAERILPSILNIWHMDLLPPQFQNFWSPDRA